MFLDGIQFATWPPAYAFPFFTAGLAVYQSMRMDLGWRIALVAAWFAIGFCWGQAAGIHVGPHATQWAEYSFVPFALAGVIGYFGDRTRTRNQFQSVGTGAIYGENVSLRLAAADDLDLLANWFADPSYTSWSGDRPKTRAEVATNYLNQDPSRRTFIIAAHDSPIGCMQAWSDEPPDGGISMLLEPEAQGTDLGTDAARTLAQHLREAGWRKITIDLLEQNSQAIHAFLNAGFVADGVKGNHLILAFEPGPTAL